MKKLYVLIFVSFLVYSRKQENQRASDITVEEIAIVAKALGLKTDK